MIDYYTNFYGQFAASHIPFDAPPSSSRATDDYPRAFDLIQVYINSLDTEHLCARLNGVLRLRSIREDEFVKTIMGTTKVGLLHTKTPFRELSPLNQLGFVAVQQWLDNPQGFCVFKQNHVEALTPQKLALIDKCLGKWIVPSRMDFLELAVACNVTFKFILNRSMSINITQKIPK